MIPLTSLGSYFSPSKLVLISQDHLLSYTFFPLSFGEFSEKERQQASISDSCGCLWVYLADLRSSSGGSHEHYNPFYEPSKHDGPLLPPAAALAPTVWPQFHLRWACPKESQAGELEALCRNMAKKFAELQKVKDIYIPNCLVCLLACFPFSLKMF